MGENELLMLLSHCKNRKGTEVEEPTSTYFYSSIEEPTSVLIGGVVLVEEPIELCKKPSSISSNANRVICLLSEMVKVTE